MTPLDHWTPQLRPHQRPLPVSEPYVAERPSGAQTAMSRVLKELAGKSHRSAAAVASRARASAAIERTGSHSARTEDDPPVDCAGPRSWRAASNGDRKSTRLNSSHRVISY